VLQSIKQDKNDFLRYHQRRVVEYAVKYPHARGLYCYHKMGSEKTILGVAIGEAVMEKYPDRKVMFISAKSLHKNFRGGIKKYWNMRDSDKFSEPGSDDAYINTQYKFVSANASEV